MLKSLKYYLYSLRGKMYPSKAVVGGELPMAVCCVFKNEAPYLKEWIEFHLQQGFQKFYLIDNRSTDDFRAVLQPYLENGTVSLWSTRRDTMDSYIQAEEFNNVLPRIKEEQGVDSWVAFLDVDEYLFTVTQKSLQHVLGNFRGKRVAAVLVNWLMFGTSECKALDFEVPMLRQLTRRAPLEHDEHRHFKPIVYLANTYKFYGGPHKPIATFNTRFYYSNGTDFTPGVPQLIHSPLRINHYWYRSENYYYTEKLKKREAFGDIRLRELEEWHMKRCNEVEDREILKQLK